MITVNLVDLILKINFCLLSICCYRLIVLFSYFQSSDHIFIEIYLSNSLFFFRRCFSSIKSFSYICASVFIYRCDFICCSIYRCCCFQINTTYLIKSKVFNGLSPSYFSTQTETLTFTPYTLKSNLKNLSKLVCLFARNQWHFMVLFISFFRRSRVIRDCFWHQIPFISRYLLQSFQGSIRKPKPYNAENEACSYCNNISILFGQQIGYKKNDC